MPPLVIEDEYLYEGAGHSQALSQTVLAEQPAAFENQQIEAEKHEQVKYFFQMLTGARFRKKMADVINRVHDRCGKAKVFCFFDILNCAVGTVRG